MRPVAFAILIWTLAEAAPAADFSVQMTPSWTFKPSTVQIHAGDSVTWINLDDFDSHDSVSADGYWDSGPIEHLETWSLTFPAVGTFAYYDSFYDQAGMIGTVVVQPATTIPSPTMTNPMHLPNGNFQFDVTNLLIGKTNIVLTATNLTAWVAIYTNVPSNTGYTYVDTSPTLARRFYRIAVLP